MKQRKPVEKPDRSSWGIRSSRGVSQPTAAPTSKMTAAGAGGAASILFVFVAGQFGVDVPPEAAAAASALLAFLAGYITKEA
jgi:hypothetical protein